MSQRRRVPVSLRIFESSSATGYAHGCPAVRSRHGQQRLSRGPPSGRNREPLAEAMDTGRVVEQAAAMGRRNREVTVLVSGETATTLPRNRPQRMGGAGARGAWNRTTEETRYGRSMVWVPTMCGEDTPFVSIIVCVATNVDISLIYACVTSIDGIRGRACSSGSARRPAVHAAVVGGRARTRQAIAKDGRPHRRDGSAAAGSSRGRIVPGRLRG